jgi:hypothetical protein
MGRLQKINDRRKEKKVKKKEVEENIPPPIITFKLQLCESPPKPKLDSPFKKFSSPDRTLIRKKLFGSPLRSPYRSPNPRKSP